MVNIIRYEPQVSTRPGPVVPVRASQSAAGDLAAGISDVADMFAGWQDEVDTARAKEADAAFTEGLNDLLYNEQSGYMYTQGGNAVDQYKSVSERIDSLYQETMDGLQGAARHKAESALRARKDSYTTRINGHAATSRIGYLNQAADARVTASINSAIYDPTGVAQQASIARQEIADIGARNGWAPEQIAVKQQEASDKIHAGIVGRLANVDPTQAMDYLARNRGNISGAALERMEAELIPVAKAYRGRKAGEAAFSGGNIEDAVRIAQNTLGMDENAQRDALKQFMANGGVNLDPSTTAWCAAFINAALAQAGIEGTGSNLARSFLDWGSAVATPKQGDLVVLSRGDPNGPYGHVGFFDGFNEDGTIRLLGGNQGDAVSVKGYDPNRVLGFRRAPEGAAPGIDQLLAIEDPVERDAALSEYNLRSKVAEGQAKAATAQAEQAAFAHVESGGLVDDLPLTVRQNLGRTEMSGLREYQNKKAAGETIVTDQEFYVDLYQMATDPARKQEFLAQKPISWATKLSKSDFDFMMKMQGDMRTKGATGAPKASAMMSMADGALRAAGIVKTKTPETYATFQSSLIRWATENPVDAQDQSKLNKRINDMLVSVLLDPAGLRNKQTGFAYQIDYDGAPYDETDDISVDDMLGATVEINGTSVSADVMREYAQLFIDLYGRDPTPQEVLEGLIESGLYDN